MPPHQEWDLNPVYQTRFTEPYAELFVSHPEFGYMASFAVDYSELTEEEWEAIYREQDGVSDISNSQSDTDLETDSVVDMTTEDEAEDEVVLVTDQGGYFTEEQIRDIFGFTVRVMRRIQGAGTIDDPIDLTNE